MRTSATMPPRGTLVLSEALEDDLLVVAERFPRLTYARLANDVGCSHKRLRLGLDRARARRAAAWRAMRLAAELAA